MPEIYVADLAAYNDGDLIGEWIDAAQDPSEIQAEINQMLSESPYSGEEWAIHDSEGFGFSVGEFASLEEVSMLARLIEDLGEPFQALYEYDSYLADSYDEWRVLVEDGYLGHYETMNDYAEEYLNDIGIFSGVDDILRTYFDYDAFARDLEIELVVVPARNGIHIFLP